MTSRPDTIFKVLKKKNKFYYLFLSWIQTLYTIQNTVCDFQKEL